MQKFFLFVILALLGSIGMVLYADYTISKSTQDKLYTSVEAIPYHKVGMVLGTAKLLASGRENPYFTYRINAMEHLYKQKKISYIVVSGDNSSAGYNEPEDMKVSLMERGIPEEVIYLDYAGFRTFDSVFRMNAIFSEDSFVIVSQAFHNERAIYIGSYLGLDVVGFNAVDVSKSFGYKTMLREKLARVKVFLDRIVNIQPKFLGDKIQIGSE